MPGAALAFVPEPGIACFGGSRMSGSGFSTSYPHPDGLPGTPKRAGHGFAGGLARLERPDSGVGEGQRWHVSVLLFSRNGEMGSIMALSYAADGQEDVQLNQRRESRVQHQRRVVCSHVKERKGLGRDEGMRTKTRTLA